MSRSRSIGLERSDTVAVRGRVAQQRARLEEELLTAYAASDRERVSELRLALAALAEDSAA